eukprot:875970-Rhodomonas_salina.2
MMSEADGDGGAGLTRGVPLPAQAAAQGWSRAGLGSIGQSCNPEARVHFTRELVGLVASSTPQPPCR